MNANDVLKMIDAGFTADEIRKMTASPESSSVILSEPESKASESPQEASAAPVKEEKKEEKKAEEPKNEKQEDVMDAIRKTIQDQIAANMKSYQDDMAKLMKVAGMPSLADVKPKSIEDIVSNFFKEE